MVPSAASSAYLEMESSTLYGKRAHLDQFWGSLEEMVFLAEQ